MAFEARKFRNLVLWSLIPGWVTVRGVSHSWGIRWVSHSWGINGFPSWTDLLKENKFDLNGWISQLTDWHEVAIYIGLSFLQFPLHLWFLNVVNHHPFLQNVNYQCDCYYLLDHVIKKHAVSSPAYAFSANVTISLKLHSWEPQSTLLECGPDMPQRLSHSSGLHSLATLITSWWEKKKKCTH